MISDEFHSKFNEILKELKYLRFLREDGCWIIEEAKEGVSEITYSDIITYIFIEDLFSQSEVYAQMVNWCQQKIKEGAPDISL